MLFKVQLKLQTFIFNLKDLLHLQLLVNAKMALKSVHAVVDMWRVCRAVFICTGTGDATSWRQFDRRLRGENDREERDDSDGGREGRRVTGNPSEALLSLFNYHPSLALLITPTHTYTHRSLVLTHPHTRWEVASGWWIHLHKVGLCCVGGEVSRDVGLGTSSSYAFSAADP